LETPLALALKLQSKGKPRGLFMPRVSLVLCALLFSAPAFAANPTSMKLAAFKDAKARLQGDIDIFLHQVLVCGPPFGLSQIQSGFGDMSSPQSAKSLLNAHEQTVSQQTSAGDQSISAVEKGVLACADAKPLLPKASAIAKTTQQALEADRAQFQTGADVVTSKRGMIQQVLGMGVGREQCMAAIKQLDVMANDTKALQSRLTDLEKTFADRVLFLQVKAAAPGACVATPGISPPSRGASLVNYDGEEMLAEPAVDNEPEMRPEDDSATIAI
jgi:hypothetical protein